MTRCARHHIYALNSKCGPRTLRKLLHLSLKRPQWVTLSGFASAVRRAAIVAEEVNDDSIDSHRRASPTALGPLSGDKSTSSRSGKTKRRSEAATMV
jgi:hypothetical protein